MFLAGGSLIWDPRNLKIDGKWQPREPFLPTEFGREATIMIKSYVEHELLPSVFHSDASGFSVQLFSNAEEVLQECGLESFLIKVIKDTLANKRTTNARVQEICSVTKATATRYLKELEGVYLERVGETGRGTYYKIKGS